MIFHSPNFIVLTPYSLQLVKSDDVDDDDDGMLYDGRDIAAPYAIYMIYYNMYLIISFIKL